MTKVLNYTPYRGKTEKITDLRRASIELHPNYIEVVTSYDFLHFDGVETFNDRFNTAQLIPKSLVSVTRGFSYHQFDLEKEECPLVTINCPGDYEPVWIRCKTNKEADMIYESLREYLLA